MKKSTGAEGLGRGHGESPVAVPGNQRTPGESRDGGGRGAREAPSFAFLRLCAFASLRLISASSLAARLEPGQLLVAAVVAGLLDELAGYGEVGEGGGGRAFGEGEAGEAEVGVGLVEAEAAAGGEGEGFVEVLAGEGKGAGVGVEGGAGEEAEGEVVLLAGAAEAVDGGQEVGGGLGEVAAGAALDGEEVGAAEGEVVEGDVEEPVVVLDDLQRLRGAFSHLGIPALIEQEVAVQEARERVEQRILRLPLLLHPLGFLELRGGFLPEARRMQGRGQRRPVDQTFRGIAALVGKLDALPGLRQGLAQLAAGQDKLAEVGGGNRGVLPVLLRDVPLQCSASDPAASWSRPSARSAKPALLRTHGLVLRAEPRREPLPGGIEEGREDGDLAAEGPELRAMLK